MAELIERHIEPQVVEVHGPELATWHEIVGHDLDADLESAAWEAARRFFELPIEDQLYLATREGGAVQLTVLRGQEELSFELTPAEAPPADPPAETGGGGVWYFRGQNAKLTFDVTHHNGAAMRSNRLDLVPRDVGWFYRTQFQLAF